MVVFVNEKKYLAIGGFCSDYLEKLFNDIYRAVILFQSFHILLRVKVRIGIEKIIDALQDIFQKPFFDAVPVTRLEAGKFKKEHQITIRQRRGVSPDVIFPE